jgi:hypothetical protein
MEALYLAIGVGGVRGGGDALNAFSSAVHKEITLEFTAIVAPESSGFAKGGN